MKTLGVNMWCLPESEGGGQTYMDTSRKPTQVSCSFIVAEVTKSSVGYRMNKGWAKNRKNTCSVPLQAVVLLLLHK